MTAGGVEEDTAEKSDCFLPEASLPHAFNVVANRVSATLQTMYSQRFGLSVVGWRVVAILGTHSPLSAKTLAELTAMDQVSVSRAVEQLVGKRIVSRRVDTVDRRRLVLRLSRYGEEVYREIVPILQAAENALVSTLPDKDVRELRRLVRAVVENAARHLPDDADWQVLLDRYGTARASASEP